MLLGCGSGTRQNIQTELADEGRIADDLQLVQIFHEGIAGLCGVIFESRCFGFVKKGGVAGGITHQCQGPEGLFL